MKEKVISFFGHRYDWKSLGIQTKLYEIFEQLINKGYTIFYDGDSGSFDKKCRDIVIKLKTKYPYIKLIKILKYYHYNNNNKLSEFYDDSIYPDIENCHYKKIITYRNRWMVEHSDIIVSHIEETYKSGAYNTIKYALKINKPIIFI